MRSMTLIPVSNISKWVFWSSRVGGWRWMGYRRDVSIGPRRSTGSPMTFMTRPRTSGPTGTVIGPPVSTAFIPRAKPSVGCMATQRTVSSPMCCSTSTTMSTGEGESNPSLVIRMAE